MNQTWHGSMSFLATGIGHFPRSGMSFLDSGDDLATNWAGRIITIDQVEKVGRNGDGQPMVSQESPGSFLGS
jgi:hypothetical protein